MDEDEISLLRINNDTSGFLLWKFSEIWELQIMHMTLLLILYLMTLSGNLVIISAIVCDQHLHTPMYFFLLNLAMQDVGSISVIIPKAVFNSLMNTRTITHAGCVAQVMFFFYFLTCDVTLLTVMAYDRYIAICNPLQYEMIMNKKACTKMIGSVWTAGFLNASLHSTVTFLTPFCSKIINQFYCEIPYLLKLACSSSYVYEIGVMTFTGTLALGCFVFVLLTYVHVFSAILRIPSIEGRTKAFSTCLPHIIVFSIFFFTASFAYLRVISDSPPHLDFIITIMYSIVPPMMNPLIYCMRNKDIKVALSRLYAHISLHFKEM